MIEELKKKYLGFILAGFFLSFLSFFGPACYPFRGYCPFWLSFGCLLAGTLLLIVGFGYLAKAKGYSGYLGLLLLIPIPFVGMIIILLLKDRNPKAEDHLRTGQLVAVGQMVLICALIILGLYFIGQGIGDFMR